MDPEEDLLPVSAESIKCGDVHLYGMYRRMKLRNHEEGRMGTFTEQFWDLVYIFVLQSLVQMDLLHLQGVYQYIILYIAAFNSWLGMAFFNTRFDTDDMLSRMLCLCATTMLVGMSSAVLLDWDDDAGTSHNCLSRFAWCYGGLRVTLVLCYVRAWIALPDLRKLLGLFVFGFSCGIGFWVAASVLPTQVRMVAVALGILFDYGTPWTLLPMMPAIHPMHMPERFACFTLLAFAACLFSLVKNMTQDVDTVRSYSLSLSLIHISEPTRLLSISYAVFCLKKKKISTPKSNTSSLDSTHII
eukprot:TRINITY_DN26044_c0_g1_i7.p1 TRINITY_DN26044_c0_g1~~TRINITY_DN26044_c0_g1_i7.p1  ORF type:complete len:300 (+),score=64.76 TRINITY_DN26044_c0_g1_i7:169-1068(+)